MVMLSCTKNSNLGLARINTSTTNSYASNRTCSPFGHAFLHDELDHCPFAGIIEDQRCWQPKAYLCPQILLEFHSCQTIQANVHERVILKKFVVDGDALNYLVMYHGLYNFEIHALLVHQPP